MGPKMRKEKNAFECLGVTRWSSQDEILKKVMEKISQDPGKMVLYRQAQMELFDPLRRITLEFFNYCETIESSPANSTLIDPNTLQEITLLDRWKGSRN